MEQFFKNYKNENKFYISYLEYNDIFGKTINKDYVPKFNKYFALTHINYFN
jgi:hypothetical protein